MGRWDYYDHFKPSTPRRAKGGIKAQSKRGAFGESWWAKRWIATLESFNIGARLGRGRSYARSGQVISIGIDKGSVKAKVQGSRPKPYDVVINIKTLSTSSWQKLTKTLANQAIFVAKLLAGEMPQDIETVFRDAGLSIFPQRLADLQTECSCPDWSNPCKHIAAVYYLLGEEFDRDPFLIFKLRGMAREELIGLLGQTGHADGTERTKSELRTSSPEEEKVPASEPLIADAPDFWNGDSLPDDFFGEVSIPPVSAALVKRLGYFPFWRAEARLFDALEPVYTQASSLGLNVFLGEDGSMKKKTLESADTNP